MPAEIARPPALARRIEAVAGPGALRAVREPGVAAVLWRRAREAALGAWLDGLPVSRLPRARAGVGVSDAGALIDAACGMADLAPSPGREALSRDVGLLARAFGAAMGTARVRLRLEAVTTDACRRFHLDRMPARLLCTYRGRGTEFGLARGDGAVDALARMGAGDVALLRGSLWPGEETVLLHRSPPIEGTGEVRLLLAIDAPGEEDAP